MNVWRLLESNVKWIWLILLVPGYPGGDCSTVSCEDDRSVCTNDICVCILGYTSIDAICLESEYANVL